nr:hypothetical protein [Tanacetum cinerariifolium]GEX64615.1 hypothetical protein [Tanacetum cinerariifolium]
MELITLQDLLCSSSPLKIGFYGLDATKIKGKAIANSPPPTYDPKPTVVADNDASSKENGIDKLMALILMSFKKIYKPTNNNIRTTSNTRNLNIDNTLRSSRGTRNSEKMMLCKQEEAGTQLSAEQVDWRDDINDEPKDHELKAHYMFMKKIQEVTQDAVDNFGPIFDVEPLQKI